MMSERAAQVLAYAGLRPREASERVIELAEELAEEYKYIQNAAMALRRLLAVS